MSIHYGVYGIQDFTSGLPGSTQILALKCVCSFRSIHYGVWFMGFGIFAPGRPGINTAWQRSAYALPTQYIMGSVHGIRFLPLGVREANTALHCNACTARTQMRMQFFRFRSTQCSSLWSSILGSWFGSSPHGKAVTWLTNHHQASRGSHNAQLSNYLCSWFMHLVQFGCGSSPHSKAIMWRTNCHKASGMNQCNPLT